MFLLSGDLHTDNILLKDVGCPHAGHGKVTVPFAAEHQAAGPGSLL